MIRREKSRNRLRKTIQQQTWTLREKEGRKQEKRRSKREDQVCESKKQGRIGRGGNMERISLSHPEVPECRLVLAGSVSRPTGCAPRPLPF